MANGKDAKRLREHEEKTEVLRIRLKNTEWLLIAAMVEAGTIGNRLRPCRASAIEALVLAGIYCLQHHPDRYREIAPFEASKRLERALSRKIGRKG